jgi:hypothetical protein
MSLVDSLLLDPYPFDIWIACRTGSPGGSGTLNDPYDGSTQAKFDSVMSTKVGPNTRVHLGPGTFQTRGYSDEVSSGWQIQAGVKISGSGMDVTTLQLVDAQTGGTAARLFAIGHALTTGAPAQPNLVDFAEVCDMTVDCNLASQSGSQVACGAVRLMGNHVKVSRVKATNWGTKTNSKPCFVIAVLTGDATAGLVEVCDAGIEGCIAVLPAASAANAPVTVLRAGPMDDAGVEIEGFGKGPFIRNCFVDCGSPIATPEYRGLSMGWCKGGVVEGNQVHNTKYGGPYQEKATTRDIVVRGNVFRNVAKGPFWNLGTKSGASKSLTGLSFAGSGPYEATATTGSNHNLSVGDRVQLLCTPSALNGTFVVTSVVSQTQFKYITPGPTGSLSSGTAEKVYGVGKLVVEGNVVELATGSDGLIGIHVDDNGLSPQATDYAHGDVVIRQNKIRYLDGWLDPAWSGEGIRVAGAKNEIVSENIVDCAPANPIKDFRCGTVTYFHNDTPAGALIQGYDGVANSKYSELETEAEDALLLTVI